MRERGRMQREREKQSSERWAWTQCSKSRWADPYFFCFTVSSPASSAVASGWEKRKWEGFYSLWACPASTAWQITFRSEKACSYSPWLMPFVPAWEIFALQLHRWYQLCEKVPARVGSGAPHNAPFSLPSCGPSSSDPAPAGLLDRSSSWRCVGAGRWLCPRGCGAAAGSFPGCQCSSSSSSCSGLTMLTSLSSAWVSGAGHLR